MYVDGAPNARGSRVKVVLESLEGVKLEKSLRLGFRASNYEAEYEALITRLRATQKLGVEEVDVFSNSRLVVNQVGGSFEARDYSMSQYLKLIGIICANFREVKVIRIPRGQNSHADFLATLTSSLDEDIPRMILTETLERPSIELQTIVATTSELGPSWMDPYIAFLSDRSLPKDAKEAEKVRRTKDYTDARSRDPTYCAFIHARLLSY